MWHVGIDLHRQTLVVAAVNDSGQVIEVKRIDCQDTKTIVETMEPLRPFRVVIEASGTYRWLYDLLRPLGTVLLAHPLRLRAMVQRRSKTDKLDAQLLANLLRIDQIPLAYIPPEKYQRLRELTRCRARIVRAQAKVKINLRALLARGNRVAPYKIPFGPRGLSWFIKQDFGPVENMVRDELLAWPQPASFRRSVGNDYFVGIESTAGQQPEAGDTVDAQNFRGRPTRSGVMAR